MTQNKPNVNKFKEKNSHVHPINLPSYRQGFSKNFAKIDIAIRLKLGIPIYSSEVLDTAGRKREEGGEKEEEEHRQLQSVMCFTQTQ